MSEHEISKTVALKDGGNITVTVTSSEPIDPTEYFVLGNANALREMGEHLTSLANAIAPPHDESD